MRHNIKKIWIFGLITLFGICVIPLQSIAAPTLRITAPSSAAEGTPFEVTVNAIPGGGGVTPDYSDVTIEFVGEIIPSNQNGITTLRAPQVDSDTDYLITAHKPGYEDASTSITIRDTSTPTEPALVITIASSVTEGNDFHVTTTADGTAVGYVQIRFANEDYETNENGLLTLTAPLVNEITEFSLTATKAGYRSDVASILVFDQPGTEPTPENGVVSGTVTDVNELPIEGAQVCVILGTSRCVMTDTNGEYMLSVPTGVYTMTATKDGYEESTKNLVTVEGGGVYTVDFILTSSEETMTPPGIIQLIEKTIQQEVTDGTIGARFKVSYEIEETPTIDIKQYSSAFDIQLLELPKSTDILKFTISAEGTAGTVLVIQIENEELHPEDIVVSYDGETLSAIPLENFFHPGENVEIGYIILWTQGNFYVLLRIPHFSEHTILVSSLVPFVETLGGITAVILFLVIAVIVAVVFIGAGELNKRF